MVSLNLSVKPIYGWGWTDGAGTVETPSEFTAIAERSGDQLVGVVGPGEFSGWKVTMSKRHTGPFDGLVNVTIQNDGAEEIFSGSAEISKDLME